MKKREIMKKIMEIIYLYSQFLEKEEKESENTLFFNEKLLKIHSDFQLILIITDPNQFLSQSLIDKVVVINNDLEENEI